ncbi:MAG: hypothetical protein CSA50_00630 [Gammaproteobacteria bacterium]|nr:MAG: hypothetical protein CSA50_00630 [Gammaproteobacteria bacterium]
MFYAIISEDVENSLDLRKKARPEHLARLNELKNAGKLLLAGPTPAIDSPDPGEAGFSGSIVIAEFENLNQAKQWADSDPFLAVGAYKKVTVKPFKKVLP